MNEARIERLNSLYTIHQAVHGKSYSPDLLYPFSEQELFEGVTQENVVVPADAPYSDFQYGHYILAPLVLVAADGLLIERGAPVDIADLLILIHTNTETNLFTELAKYLTPEDMEQIRIWMNGEALIPRNLVEQGASTYGG
jgi:hypothetical protein